MEVLGNDVTVPEAFKAANGVLQGAVAGIAESHQCARSDQRRFCRRAHRDVRKRHGDDGFRGGAGGPRARRGRTRDRQPAAGRCGHVRRARRAGEHHFEQKPEAARDQGGDEHRARLRGGRCRPLLASGKPRQRGRYTINEYQRVAAVYDKACRDGSRSPTRDTAEALGLRLNQAVKLVQRCRRMDLLPQTEPGVALGSTEEAG